MKLAGVALDALASAGLPTFPRDGVEEYQWRIRVSADLWDEALAAWGWAANEMHDGEFRLFGYFVFRDEALPPGQVAVEAVERLGKATEGTG